jgi:hypothetical protein
MIEFRMREIRAGGYYLSLVLVTFCGNDTCVLCCVSESDDDDE